MAFPALLAAADRAALHLQGGPVRYTTSAGVAADVEGIFDATYVRSDAGPTGVVSFGPAVFLRLSDLPSDPDADQPVLLIAGVTYRVAEPKKDGQGGVLLMLHQVS
jgi:hypothetical protein